MIPLSLITATLLLCAALYTDIIHGLIPNRITLGFAGIALMLHLGTGLLNSPTGSVAAGSVSAFLCKGFTAWITGLTAGGLVLLIPYVQRAAGGGDLKLFAALGAITDPWAVCQIFLFACVAWGVLGLMILSRLKTFSGLALPADGTCKLRSSRALPFSIPAAVGFMVFVYTGGI
jgi:Flp pilus assembly protein protease CpaA